jgi:hypothetical protein
MSVAITAQVPVAASSPETALPQAAQGTGATSEQGLVDFFAKARVDAGNGQIVEATNSAASSGEMLGKLREFVEKAYKSDAENRATRAKQRAAAAEADIELASLDTLGPLGKFNSFAQFNPIGHSSSVGQFASENGLSLPPGPASESLGPAVTLPPTMVQSNAPVSAMVDKMRNDAMDSAIQNMWMRVVAHATTSVTKSVMTLLKGQ